MYSHQTKVLSTEVEKIPNLFHQFPNWKNLEDQNINFTLDLSFIDFAKIAGTNFISLYLKWLQTITSKFEINIVGISANDSVTTYLDRMEFFDFLGLESPLGDRRKHSSRGKFCEITTIEADISETEADRNLTEDLTEILEDQYEGDSEKISDISHVISELMANVVHHAELDEPGSVAAQYYDETNPSDKSYRYPPVVEFSICDLGIGVHKSLSNNPEVSAEINEGKSPLKLASKLGISGKLDNHSGYGLYLAQELARRNKGTFLLISGKEYYYVGPNENRNSELAFPWPGTSVFLSYRMDRQLPLTDIFDDIGSDSEEESIFHF